MARKDNLHTISILVANKPGVLVRCAQVFARRGFNIDSLVVSASQNPKYSRMTITAEGDVETLEQIIKQSAKLIDVLHVIEHSQMDAISREYALAKVKYTAQNKPIIQDLVNKFNAKILEEDAATLIIAQGGTTQELDDLEDALKEYGLVEVVRSGKLVIARGEETT